MKKLFNYPMLIFLLVGCTFASLLIGVKSIRWLEGWQLNEAEWSIIVHSRLPRTISILLASAALSICGLIMQRLSQNRFVSPSTVGIMDWAKLGMLISLLFFKDSSILLKLTIAIVFTIVGMMLFLLLLNQIPWKDSIIIPLVGLIFGEVVGSVATFLGIYYQLLQNVQGWLQGNFAIITSGRFEMLYLVIPCLVVIVYLANKITIVGFGPSFAQSLGVSFQTIVHLSLIMVSIMTAVVVITVGSLPFLGFVIPNLVIEAKGENVRGIIGYTALFGAIFVMICDIVGRLIIFPYELPISVSLGLIGSAIFFYYLWKVKGRMV